MEGHLLKQRAPRNRTITISDSDIFNFKKQLVKINEPVSLAEIENKTIHQDIFEALDYLPSSFVDLVFVDPPITSIKLSILLHLRRWSQGNMSNGLILGLLNSFGC